MTEAKAQWMRDQLSTHLIDFHNAGSLRIGEEFDAEALVETLASAGIRSVTIFSKDNYGQAYYDTAFGNKHVGLEGDYFGELSRAAKARDMRVLAYHAFNLEYLAGLSNPDWVVTAKDGTKYYHRPNSEYREYGETPAEQDNFVNSFTASLEPGYYEHYLRNMTFNLICVNSPYLQELLWPQLEEILTKFDIDGFFLDMLFYPVDSCYCDYCKREMTLRGIDLEDAAAVYQFKEDSMFRAVRETTKFIRSVNPDVVVGYDNTAYLGCSREKNYNDYYMFEAAIWQLGYMHAPMYARYLRNTGRPFELVTHSFHHMWGDYGGYKHPNEMKYEAATILANGGGVWLGTQAHPNTAPDPAVYKMIGETNAFIEARAEYFQPAVAVPSIAVFAKEDYLYAALDNFMFSNPSRIHNFQGATKLLIEAHQQFDLVDDLMEIDKYKVLVLPEVGELSPEFQKRVTSFVQEGGILLATHLSSFAGNNFALADVLGVDYVGTSPYTTTYARITSDSIARGLPGDFASFAPSVNVERREGVEALGFLANPMFERSVSRFHSHSQTPPGRRTTDYPAVTLNRFGEGVAIYIAMPVFSDYFREDYYVYRTLVENVLELVYPENIVQRVDAPMTVEVSLMEQIESDRLVVHLTNCQPKRFSMRMPRIEDAYPIGPIGLELRIERPVRSVTTVPDGTVSWKHEGGVLSLVVSEVTIHNMVVVEF